MQLCIPTASLQRLPAVASTRQQPVLRTPLAVAPRGGLTSLTSSSRRNLIVARTGSDPGVPTQGSRYNTPGGGAGGSAGGGSGGSGGSGGRGGEHIAQP